QLGDAHARADHSGREQGERNHPGSHGICSFLLVQKTRAAPCEFRYAKPQCVTKYRKMGSEQITGYGDKTMSAVPNHALRQLRAGKLAIGLGVNQARTVGI